MLGRRRMKIAAAVVAALAVIVPMTTASAATQELEFTNTAGSVAIGSLPAITIPAGDAGLAGTWDDVTGDFTGATQFNPISIAANPPSVPVDVVVTLGNNGASNVTGTIDPTTGDVSLTASMILTLEVPALSATCSSSPFDVNFVDDVAFAPLPFDPAEDYSVSLDGGFTIPAFEVASCALADAINLAVGLPAEGGMSLDLVRGTPAPPTTPTTSADTTSTTAATAATTSPRFTG
jgi:hypothetical protein